jgi:phage gp36-like protein
MPYCSLSDLIKAETETALIQLTDDAGAGAVDETVINDAISVTGDEIDARLRGRVTVPDTVPDMIKLIAVELVVWNLYRRRFSNNMPDAMLSRRKQALADLDRVAKGEIRITDEQATEKIAASIRVKTRDRIFNDDLMDRF